MPSVELCFADQLFFVQIEYIWRFVVGESPVMKAYPFDTIADATAG